MEIVAVVILSALFALIGKNRKIGYGWSFVICLLASPLIGLIVMLCSKKKGTEFIEVEDDNNKEL